MLYQLVLSPRVANEAILNPETPLDGLKFVEVAGACLRRNLDTETKARHLTLGALYTYTISVPQSVAIESGWFNESSKVYLPCEMNALASFIFYGALVNRVSTTKPVYPYYNNEVTVVSYIDELAFINEWRNRGFPTLFTALAGGITPGTGEAVPGTDTTCYPPGVGPVVN